MIHHLSSRSDISWCTTGLGVGVLRLDQPFQVPDCAVECETFTLRESGGGVVDGGYFSALSGIPERPPQFEHAPNLRDGWAGHGVEGLKILAIHLARSVGISARRKRSLEP